ncbi:MAG: DUF4038 domain-containing protein [Bacteroidota bacterium]|nr:DUF4038 domain-containing protein [Bacteroidota bacterium]
MKQILSILAMILVLSTSSSIEAQENSAQTQQKVALALSCGGARGITHIGVIRELEKQGYEISSIAGTSMGALVGGIYAAGKLDVYEEWLCSLSIMDMLTLVDFTISVQGMIRAEKVLEEIQKFIPDQEIEDLPIPFVAISTDLRNGKEVVISEGSLFEAIRASISIPLVFTPASKNDTIYVDGGVLNPVPTNRVLRQDGDILIAVDINANIRNQYPIPHNPDWGVPEPLASGKMVSLQQNQAKTSVFNKIWEMSYLNLTSETLSLMISQISSLTLDLNPPDILIEVSRHTCGMFDFYKAKELIEIGEKVTRRSMLNSTERLRVSHTNPHLLETVNGVPVFLNNYTAWSLIRNGSREEIAELITICKSQKFNVISAVIPFLAKNNGTFAYSSLSFYNDSAGIPDPSRPFTTPGNNPEVPGEYDFWDHVDYVIDHTAENGMYISLHPTWGNRVSGGYNGSISGEEIIFDIENAYKYGQWLGRRYGGKDNLLWMLGGDRSAIYDHKNGLFDYCEVWRAMAEGLTDGANGVDNQDGQADYGNILISFHPRKWAPNSSEWFHNDPWLTFNSIQDTPYDQVVSIPHDYKLEPVKPTWLFEGRYEGRMSDWGMRYQAYQTVFAGGFGSTYGSEIYSFPSNWRELAILPGAKQMAHLYTVAREIWTDKQFLDRMPDQNLIVGDQGNTYGDGERDDSGKLLDKPGSSDRISALRGGDGSWAIVYSANGRDLTLNLSLLCEGKFDVYWFNPRNGKWWVDSEESDKITPLQNILVTGDGSYTFDPPGIPGIDNDWLLILSSHNLSQVAQGND